MLQVTVLPPQHSLSTTRHANSVTTEKAKAATAGKPAPKPRKEAWCWGHGHTFHNSSECTSQLPGHKEDATKANRMGGASYTWTKLTSAQRAEAIKNGPAGVKA